MSSSSGSSKSCSTTAGGEATSDYFKTLGNIPRRRIRDPPVRCGTRRSVQDTSVPERLPIGSWRMRDRDLRHGGLRLPSPRRRHSLRRDDIANDVCWLRSFGSGTPRKERCPSTASRHRREAFYWATVLATLSILGTALGDFTATTLGLGCCLEHPLRSGHLDPGSRVVASWSKLSHGLWMAYVVARPRRIGHLRAYISRPVDWRARVR